jgi:lipopolysaccharide export system permease protein
MGHLIDRYLIRHFVFAYLASFVSLLAMYIVIDVFAKFDEFATPDAHKVALKQHQGELAAGRQTKAIKIDEKSLPRQLKSFAINVGNYYAYRIPVFFQRINGILLLLAAAFTIGWMDRQNELTPLLSAGVPIGRLLIPIYIATACFLAIGVLNTELLIPRCADSLLRRAEDPMGKRPLLVPGAFDVNHIHVEARVAFPQKHMIQYARVTLPPDLFGSTLHITCAEMYYRPGNSKTEHGWYMNGCKPATLPYSHPAIHQLQPGQFFLQTDLTYERLTRRPTWYLFQPTPLLLDTIEHEHGTAQRSAILAHIHQRLVAPLYDLLLLLLGLPLIASRSQWNIFIRVGWCLLTFALVQGLTMATAMLTKTDLVDPTLAAWLPLMLLGPLVPPLLSSMRT